MSSRLALSAIVLLALSVSGCGDSGAGGASASSAAAGVSHRSAAPVKDKDRDFDGSPAARYDPDDYLILAYGREAGPVERRAVTAMVKRYYRYAAAANGTKACALMSAPLKESVLELYGPEKDPTAPRQGTCSAVARHMFERRRGHLRIETATIVVRDVRLGEQFGYAILSFRSLPDRHLLLYQEAGRWRLDEPLDARLV